MPVDPEKLVKITDVEQLKKNAERLDDKELAHRCFKRLVELRLPVGTAISDVELDCWRAVEAAEQARSELTGRRLPLNRTRKKIKKDGIVETAAYCAGKREFLSGFNLLAEWGHLELTFEFVALKYPEKFPSEVREVARDKLLKAGLAEERLPNSL